MVTKIFGARIITTKQERGVTIAVDVIRAHEDPSAVETVRAQEPVSHGTRMDPTGTQHTV